MGKEDEERPPGAAAPEPRCAAALFLGAAVLLSAVFWLPPFAGRRGRRAGAPDLDGGLGADIVASFRLQKTVAELKENISKLENDIYDEIGVPYSSVAVSSLERIAGSNWTNVVFGIWPYPKNSSILPTWLSILRSSFMSLVVQQSTLHLTTSLFGNASLFEVRKFPGGITIIPPQNAFLLQKPYASFNFSLNFAIYKVQDKVSQLKDQMKLGLFLNSHENLYVKLTNLEGSTLAETISNSSSGNLGLNNTVFGRVKQPKEKAHHLTPAVAPVTFQHHTAPVASPPRSIAPAAVPQNSRVPVGHRDTPAPAPPFLSASPLPAVVFTHVQPPSESVRSIKPPDGMPAMAPAPFSSSASGLSPVHGVVVLLLLYLLASLL
uniref:DUF7036 domain-containing protein n=1 Tax=Ananas comosus var. bracteatus TaxID=296719 RepID=A0A6V7PRS2_ANACO|nr:unnamed protein product [Ananas comosus var. bracteatus]